MSYSIRKLLSVELTGDATPLPNCTDLPPVCIATDQSFASDLTSARGNNDRLNPQPKEDTQPSASYWPLARNSQPPRLLTSMPN
jgi:hypothetical protein